MNRRELITLVWLTVVLLGGCASHLAKQGCKSSGPFSFTCPWELRK